MLGGPSFMNVRIDILTLICRVVFNFDDIFEINFQLCRDDVMN